MKYFIIVGEASGDLHGANLIKEILAKDKSAEFQFWGGDLMIQAAGKNANKHIKELAIMGFLEVIVKLSSIRQNFIKCKQQILDFNPDALIMIDYPGFNLRIASFAKKNNLKTFYYISPKVWAWKQKRVFRIKKYIDVLFTILPFETEFYKQFDYDVTYVGNPLMDAIESYRKKEIPKIKSESGKPIIAILPGSRDQEIKRLLPLMIELADSYDNYEFIIAGAPNFDEKYYSQFFKKNKYRLLFDQTYSILESAESAIVTSGTATLETALFNIPQVVCYKANKASYQIGKRLVKVKYMSLVNLILDRLSVAELLQDEFNINRLTLEFNAIVKGGNRRSEIIEDYKELMVKVGKAGASERVAEGVINGIKLNMV